MGTSLYQIGNHQIHFKERSFKELTNELKFKLDNIALKNEDFLHEFALSWNSDNSKTMAEIKSKKEWTFDEENENYSFNEEKRIELFGPHDLHISIEEFKLTFWNPPYRYKQWIELKNIDGSDAIVHRNYWRQYMFQIISKFGGDRVIYLADNGHPLDKFIDYDCPFEEIEDRLLAEFGKPAKTFKEVSEDDQNRYLIDRFLDLKVLQS